MIWKKFYIFVFYSSWSAELVSVLILYTFLFSQLEDAAHKTNNAELLLDHEIIFLFTWVFFCKLLLFSSLNQKYDYVIWQKFYIFVLRSSWSAELVSVLFLYTFLFSQLEDAAHKTNNAELLLDHDIIFLFTWVFFCRNQSLYIEVAQGAIFMEQNMRFERIFWPVGNTEKKIGLIMSNFWSSFFHVFVGKRKNCIISLF